MSNPRVAEVTGIAFQIAGTPPAERLRRQKAAEELANAHVSKLILTPFTPIPKVSYENVKLGQASVRMLLLQNPSKKPIKISLKMPKSESGFEVDYSDFVLPPVSEATLKIGWVPSKPGNYREKVMVKYGVRDSQVVLLASCIAPTKKTFSTRGRRTPLQNSNPNRTQTSAKAGKKGGDQKPNLPENPVKRLIGQVPEIRKITTEDNQGPTSKKTLKVLPNLPEPSWSPQKLGSDTESIPDVKSGDNVRRETFVKDPAFSFVCSTPMDKEGPGFKPQDVSLIPTVQGKRSCKELRFQDTFKVPESTEMVDDVFVTTAGKQNQTTTLVQPMFDHHDDDKENVYIRRNTFVINAPAETREIENEFEVDVPQIAPTATQTREVMEESKRFEVDIQQIVNRYVDLDDTVNTTPMATRTREEGSEFVEDIQQIVNRYMDLDNSVNATPNATQKRISQVPSTFNNQCQPLKDVEGLKKHHAAIVIQSKWKSYVAQKRYSALKRQATFVQNIWRYKKFRKVKQKRISAAKVIQRAWIMHRFNKGKTLSAQANGSWFKRCQDRQLLIKLLDQRISEKLRQSSTLNTQCQLLQGVRDYVEWSRIQHAAIVIQSKWKSYVAQKRYSELKSKTIFVQNVWRYKVFYRAVLFVQTHWRFGKLKQKRNSAAEVIQRSWRLHLFNQKRKHSAQTIGNWYKRCQERRQLIRLLDERILEKMKVFSAIKIQCFWKTWRARKKYLAMRHSVFILQRAWRQIITQRKDLKLRRTVIFVQNIWQYKNLLRRRQVASLRIQAWWKNILGKRQLLKGVHEYIEWSRKQHAATVIQSKWKSYSAQKKFSELKCQTIFLQYVWRYKLMQRERRLNQAVLFVQTYWKFGKLKQKRIAAAGVIQRSWRLHLSNQERKHSAQVIGNWYKRIQERRQMIRLLDERSLEKLRASSAIKIQSFWKTWRARKKYLAICHSVCILQRVWRQFDTQRRYLKLRRTVLFVQSVWRYKCLLRRRQVASLRIQTWWRSIMEKQLFLKGVHEYLEKSKRKHAVIVIQSNWKAYVAQKRYSKLKNQNRREHAAIVIQSKWRAHVAQKSYSNLRNQNRRERAAIVIQSKWKAYVARKRYSKLKSQTIRLQNAWRYKILMREQRVMSYDKSILIIQSVIRMQLSRLRFRRQRAAAQTIQSFFRGYRVRTIIQEKCEVRQQEVLQTSVTVNEEMVQRIEEVRAKVKIAQAEATEDAKLCNRTSTALDYLYSSKDMAKLIKCVKDLDISTRYSAKCCDQLLANRDSCFLILIDFVKRCNRSVPHMEIISGVFDVFINLSRYPPAATMMASLSEDSLVECLLYCLSVYKDKSTDIFCKACSILWILSHHESVSKCLKSKVYLKRLETLLDFHKKRHDKEEANRRRQTNTNFSATSNNKKKTLKQPALSCEPVWKIKDNVVRNHNNAFIAISTLMKKIQNSK